MKIAVLGLGIIGSAWAENLRQDGYQLGLWNRTPREVQGFENDPGDAIKGADFIFLVVSDSAAVFDILHRIGPRLQPGQIILQCSTILPTAVQEAAEIVAPTGAFLLDTPFTGSLPAAQQRQVVFFAGGGPDLLARAQAILVRLSKAVLPMGPVGQASAIKLSMNLNIAQVAQALCESLQLARSAGISDQLFYQALQLNVSRSPLADLKGPKLQEADYSPQFSLKHMLKDLRQARELAGSLELPQLSRTIEIYEEGVRRGWADDDFIGLVRLIYPV